MTIPEIVMWLVVLAVGLPSAMRNPTAGALSLAWLVPQIMYLRTGNSLPINLYAYADIFVIVVIMAKSQPYGCPPDGSTEVHLRSVLLIRSAYDRIILAIFPIMWVFYVVDIDEYRRWMVLWVLVIIQFLVSGCEALSIYRRSKLANSGPPNPPFAEYRIAWEGFYGRFRHA